MLKTQAIKGLNNMKNLFFFSGDTGVKLLGVPGLPHKSSELAGDLIGDATIKLIDEWPGVRNACKIMVFDTTTSNTGEKIFQLKFC